MAFFSRLLILSVVALTAACGGSRLGGARPTPKADAAIRQAEQNIAAARAAGATDEALRYAQIDFTAAKSYRRKGEEDEAVHEATKASHLAKEAKAAAEKAARTQPKKKPTFDPRSYKDPIPKIPANPGAGRGRAS